MSEKRFSVDDDGIYDTQEKKHFKFIAYDWMECDIYECCEKLNEQQATIEHLTKRRDRWRELSNSFSAYCECYEKAIERAFEEKPYPSEEDIYRIYAELEKELEDD